MLLTMNKVKVQLMKNNGALVWAVVSVFLILIGGAIGLVITGRDIESILYLYTGLVGIAAAVVPLLIQVSKLRDTNEEQSAVLEEQNHKLDQITEQTNGILDAKIERIVRSALNDYGSNGSA